MRPGETKTIKIPANKAFGTHHKNMVRIVDRSKFPADPDPEVGQKFDMSKGDDPTTVVRVSEISGSKVTLDANHPLAGKDLTFDIELVEIL
jgi:peptidylprolyl isomerase